MNIPDASKYLTSEEQKELHQRSDVKGLIEVIKTWSIIGFTFALVYFYTNVFTVIVALFILGGRQLGCSIIMHDTSHKSMFRSSGLNDFFGKWFGGYPVLNDLLRYRSYHMNHHINTGLESDPDINLTTGYPAGWKSMLRKFGRDLSGLTGIKSTTALVMMHLGYLEYDQGNNPRRIDQSARSWSSFFTTAIRNLGGPILTNLILFGILSMFDPRLYLLWVAAFLTTFQFVIRVRSIAEHSMVEDRKDPNINTRTTYANVIEHLLFAPHNVNYHLEHHMLMGVPCYNLPKMHRLIKDRGFFKKGTLAHNYWEVISSAAASS